MATHIFFVRHGKTENEGNIIYGRSPGYPLSETGKAEAEIAAKTLGTKNIVQIYTSPLERTFQTADIIAKQCPEAKIEHLFDLTEVESTSWQGLSADQLFTSDKYETFINDPNADIGTENLNQLAARMSGVVHEILKKHQRQNVVCVSHEFPILCLKFFLEKKQLSGIKTIHLRTSGILDFIFDESGNFVSATEINA